LVARTSSALNQIPENEVEDGRRFGHGTATRMSDD
jgi:hypothetical protein